MLQIDALQKAAENEKVSEQLSNAAIYGDFPAAKAILDNSKNQPIPQQAMEDALFEAAGAGFSILLNQRKRGHPAVIKAILDHDQCPEISVIARVLNNGAASLRDRPLPEARGVMEAFLKHPKCAVLTSDQICELVISTDHHANLAGLTALLKHFGPKIPYDFSSSYAVKYGASKEIWDEFEAYIFEVVKEQAFLTDLPPFSYALRKKEIWPEPLFSNLKNFLSAKQIAAATEAGKKEAAAVKRPRPARINARLRSIENASAPGGAEQSPVLRFSEPPKVKEREEAKEKCASSEKEHRSRSRSRSR